MALWAALLEGQLVTADALVFCTTTTAAGFASAPWWAEATANNAMKKT
jgi:hypothetical protein